MASQYKSLRCNGCDGTLEYNKEKKVWVCIYCGNEIHREEEYDGLYTIKNVVKQVLVDLAYVRMDSAQKNLIECEKIASNYVGTVIAGLCFKVYRVITPGACQPGEVKGLYGQIKRQYDTLKAMDQGISAEEEALYDSFEGSGDAFGVLMLVFDTLGAKEHLEFVEKFLDPATIYSVDLNSNLLNYAFKNGKEELIEGIFSNADNINCREALLILLDSYSDCPGKKEYVNSLFRRANLREDDYKRFTSYLTETSDSLATRIEVYTNAVSKKAAPSINIVMDHILSDAGISNAQAETVIRAFCNTRPRDGELYELVDQIYTKHSGSRAVEEMKILLDSGLFIRPQERTIRFMINRADWSAEERFTMLEYTNKCGWDVRTKDAILADILLHNSESTDIRLGLVKKMTEYVDTISTAPMTDYILKCNIDGERKPEVLEALLSLNLNMSFFREVLSKYLQSSGDSEEVKKQISQMLSSQGLQVNSQVLTDMACSANKANYMETVSFIQQSVRNGARIDNDSLSTYLEKVKPEEYCGELLSLLHNPSSRISDLALARYVLYSDDTYNVKLKNSVVFADQNGKKFGASDCKISYLGANISCNLFQAYILLTPDAGDTMEAVTSAMKKAGARLNADMIVNGQSIKFKRYILDKKQQLTSETIQLCEDNKVFSVFF